MSEASKDTDEGQPVDVIPFTVSNKSCDDEVTLLFDDGNKLFVSRSFLCYASPVFDAMFTLEFKEKISGVVELKDKCKEDFLEFLLTIHPFEQKRTTKNNVYKVMKFAGEYQVKGSIRRCINVLMMILRAEYGIIKDKSSALDFDEENRCIEAVLACLQVVSLSALYGHDELTNKAIDCISLSGSKVYLKEINLNDCKQHLFSNGNLYVTERSRNKKLETCKECRAAFDALPASVQNKIMRKRLDLTEDNTTR